MPVKINAAELFSRAATLRAKIDHLGLLQAEAAPLIEKIAKLKDEIGAVCPAGMFEGDYYRVAVVHTERVGVPIKTLIAKLKRLRVGQRWFREHTARTPYTSVTCSARTGRNLDAFKAKVRELTEAASA